MNDARFTQRAQEALKLAQDSSAQLGHGYVGSEHLLLGLAREEGCVAARVLRAAGLEHDALQEAVAALVGTGDPDGAPAQGLTPGARRSSSSPSPRRCGWATGMWVRSTCCWASSGRGTGWRCGPW